jgi:hypothetical protein
MMRHLKNEKRREQEMISWLKLMLLSVFNIENAVFCVYDFFLRHLNDASLEK